MSERAPTVAQQAGARFVGVAPATWGYFLTFPVMRPILRFVKLVFDEPQLLPNFYVILSGSIRVARNLIFVDP